MSDTNAATQHTGKVKWFNQKEGYGFILPDKGGKDVFFHKNEVEKSGMKADEMVEGIPVTYFLQEYKGRESATKLQKA